MRHVRLLISLLCLLGLASTLAQYSPRNVECIAPANPGGGWDFTCRVPGAQVLQELNLVSGNVRVTNLAGGGGGIAFSTVVTQRANDENLIVAASTATAARLAQNVYAGFTVDNVRWIGSIGADYGVIAVSKDSPYTSLEELLGDMRSNPGSVTFVGGSAVGGWDHLKVLLVADAAGIEDLATIRYVAFDGGGEAMVELIGGRASAFTGDISETLAQLEAGNIRVLTVLAPERVDAVDAPSVFESGYEVIGANWRGFYMPPNISDEAYNYWVDAIRTVGESDTWSNLREENGLEEFESYGADFEAFVVEQVAAIREISERLGLMQQ